ncbi:ABC transporter substrate-binding protein [Megalodesulfovibrio gigas]|nr:ABC transporter substrate-binding protein [Megalodesulfovibrio gigas]
MQHSPASSRRGVSAVLQALLLALLASLALSACTIFEKQPIQVPPRQPDSPVHAPATPAPPVRGPLTSADQAFAARNYAAAITLYGQAARNTALPLEQRRIAWQRLAEAALLVNQATAALDAVNGWRQMEPRAVANADWQTLCIKTLRAMPDSQPKSDQLQALQRDSASPPRLQAMAGVSLAAISWRMADLQNAYARLAQLAASYPGQLADLEATLYDELQTMPPSNGESLLLLIPQEQHRQFPATIILLEKARRLKSYDPAQAAQIAQYLQGAVANTALLAAVLGGGAAVPPAAASGGVAIAVPLSGPYGNIGWKIVRGAGIARDALARQGVTMVVEAIDTEQPDWLDKLRALPETITVVGGPLRADRIQALDTANLSHRFAFFAFANGIGVGTMQEGRDAWRFFSSPQDQVRTLVDFARSQFNVSSVGILTPEDDFSQRMTQLFEQEARARGMAVSVTMPYPASDRNAWYDVAGRFLQAGEVQAVFMPAGFDHAEIMLPNFIYHQRRDLLFLGPSIWGQALSRNRNIVERDFQRAAFPWAWRMDAPGAASRELAQQLQATGGGAPDLWAAIGYDFVRFMHAVGQVPSPIDATFLNHRLTASSIEWSMAPIHYDAAGRASQQLFIFRPTRQGYVLFDAPAGTAAPAPTESDNSGEGAPHGEAAQPAPAGGQPQ